jgi:hypothetical protein
MQFIYFFGVILFTPLLTIAHEGEHTSAVWYQEPVIATLLSVGFIGLVVLLYGVVTKHQKTIMFSGFFLFGVAISTLLAWEQGGTNPTAGLHQLDFGAGKTVTLYKSPNCGCCSGHAAALEAAGFAVNIEMTNDLDAVKQEHSIPVDGASCHTSVIGDYVVEGHVPLEAIETLLSEKPEIAGIGLPGMPIGTPGMPGRKTAPYEVYKLSENGVMSPYLTI